jgi:hypothetical protein
MMRPRVLLVFSLLAAAVGLAGWSPPAGADAVSATATGVGISPDNSTCSDNPSFDISGRGIGDGFGEDGWGTLAGQAAPSPQPSASAGMNNKNAAALCNDMLMTEKYVSGSYDTAIFELKDANVRNALNHIQKEEQQHGEGIFNYMQSNGMYNAQ